MANLRQINNELKKFDSVFSLNDFFIFLNLDFQYENST